MKNGIILAGGTGSRLYPLTHVVNKHLLGVDGKFIIDYPLDTLKKMGCENVTVILGGNHFSQVVDHLKDGAAHGMKFNYVYQGAASGIAQAINLCERFVADQEQFAVILGDNIYENPVNFFYDDDRINDGDNVGQCFAEVALHRHSELNRFGVATINQNKKIIKIEEKPKVIDTNYDNYAITGCYLFNQKFFRYFRDLKPSARGEYEITDILHAYHQDDSLHYTFTDGLWSDAGTHESVEFVNNYFHEKKHGTP
jgi:glucose-1-phosphate thymidylyltransferase